MQGGVEHTTLSAWPCMLVAAAQVMFCLKLCQVMAPSMCALHAHRCHLTLPACNPCSTRSPLHGSIAPNTAVLPYLSPRDLVHLARPQIGVEGRQVLSRLQAGLEARGCSDVACDTAQWALSWPLQVGEGGGGLWRVPGGGAGSLPLRRRAGTCRGPHGLSGDSMLYRRSVYVVNVSCVVCTV